MKKFLTLFVIVLQACSLPAARDAATSTPIPAPTASATATVAPQPTAQIGSEANPVILALAPSAHPAPEMVESGEFLAGRLEELTGYRIVTVAPASEADIVEAFAIGNVHIAVLSPFGYLAVHENEDGGAALAGVRSGQAVYGAQFIARRDAGFEEYFDPLRGENTAEALEALAQFNDKKPCWSDPVSPSGFVVPLGFLNQAGVAVRAPAFLEGHAPLVRAVYAEGICDFGATYIDARELPALEADYPDVLEKVLVIWRIPAIIPYEQVVMASGLTPEMKRALLRAFIDLMTTPEGLAAIQTVYGVEALQPAEDSQYDQFAQIVQAAGIELDLLLK